MTIAVGSGLASAEQYSKTVVENGRAAVDRMGNQPTGRYFGLEVEVIHRMKSYSLIRFRGRVFIVDSADLLSSQCVRRTARSAAA